MAWKKYTNKVASKEQNRTPPIFLGGGEGMCEKIVYAEKIRRACDPRERESALLKSLPSCFVMYVR